MILTKQFKKFNDYNLESFVTTKYLLKLFEKRENFKNDLIELFNVDENNTEVIKIGNAKFLINSLLDLDSQCEKIDIKSKIKDINLKKLFDAEKAIFEIFGITDNFILKQNKSDLLEVETKYSAKSDILDYYNLSKFANYCRDQEYEDLIDDIKSYLKQKNFDNNEEKNLRLVFKNDDEKFYLRAATSPGDYQDFGINFSTFVALMSLKKYIETSDHEIFIDYFNADDSEIYVSFTLKQEFNVNNNLNLSFKLILENDEIRRSAVSFNGIFKLKYKDRERESEIYLKPKGLKKKSEIYPVDLLTYQHRGSVKNVFEKINDLPKLIDFYIEQVSGDADRISKISNPDDVRKHIAKKVRRSKKVEFKMYKDEVFNKLMSITVDSTFTLFQLLRDVEELFEHQDIISIDFWRGKLYEALIERD